MSDIVETVGERRRHDLLADVAETSAQFLIDRHGLEEQRAIDLGNHLADFLAEHWKGQYVYIVADTQYKLTQRDMDIFKRMERGNARELAAEYKISFVRIYQIYKRVLAEARRRRQNDLFADAEPQDASPTK